MKTQDEVYVQDIIEALERIVAFAPANYDAFIADMQARQAIERNFEIIGETAKRISPGGLAHFPEMPWRELKGVRDRLIHAYDFINTKILWSAVEDASRILAILKNGHVT